jgi:holo-[acyl-carrier protein] synthase
MTKIHQGIDIVEIARFQEVLERNSQFIQDIFTEQERSYCQSMKEPYRHFAGRFAAKESYLKALGTGLSGSGIDHVLKEIEVVPTASGKPQISVSGWAEKITKKKKTSQCSVSISHAANYAVATVILVENE